MIYLECCCIFPACSCMPLCNRLHVLSHHWSHSAVLRCVCRGVPVDRWTRQQVLIAYWGMGKFWGNANAQNAKAHLIGHIKVCPHDDLFKLVNYKSHDHWLVFEDRLMQMCRVMPTWPLLGPIHTASASLFISLAFSAPCWRPCRVHCSHGLRRRLRLPLRAFFGTCRYDCLSCHVNPTPANCGSCCDACAIHTADMLMCCRMSRAKSVRPLVSTSPIWHSLSTMTCLTSLVSVQEPINMPKLQPFRLCVGLKICRRVG